MENNKFFLAIDDLVVNLLITLKEKGLDPKELSYNEVVKYGEKLVEYGKKQKYNFYLILSRDKTRYFLNNNSHWASEYQNQYSKGIKIIKDYTIEKLIEDYRGYFPLDVLLIIENSDLKKDVVDKYISEHNFTISTSRALGNFIISKDGKCITKRQFDDFLDNIQSACCVEDIDEVTNFEEFGDRYNYLVKRIDNIIFPKVDIEILKRYFRTGLPKNLVNIFDEVTVNIKDKEEDLAECQNAYIKYLEEFKEYETEKEMVTNSIQNIIVFNEENKSKVYIKE